MNRRQSLGLMPLPNGEYKKSRGLGDTIEKITRATGIKKVVNTITKTAGKDCGCGERRDSLNRIFPYNKKQ